MPRRRKSRLRPPKAPKKQSRIPKPPVKTGGQVQAPPAPKLRIKIPGLHKEEKAAAKPCLVCGTDKDHCYCAGDLGRKPKKSVQIAKSRQDKECPACGGKQFKNGAFKGCVCFRDLSKSVEVQDSGDNLVLSFGNSWDSDAIATLLEALGVK
jgi:hypothetical protein